MTAASHDIVPLTDDEVVAIAVELGAPWGGPLPTVDIGDADALQSALVRGRRSLMVRGLTADAGDGPAVDAGLLSDLATGTAENILLSTFVATRDLTYVSEGTAAVVYADAAGHQGGDAAVLVEAVSGSGIHYFAIQSRRAAVAAVTETVAEVFAEGLTVQAGSETLPDALVHCVSTRPARGLLGVVAHGAARLIAVGSSGTVEPVASPATVDGLMAALLAPGP